MKKINYSLLLMMVVCMTFLTACKDDNGSNPIVTTPTTFVINDSPVAGQYIRLSEDNTVNLTWSQPNYGFNAYATYQVQVGLVNGGNVIWNEKDGAPKYLETTYTICKADISGDEIAEALCSIDGFNDADSYVDMGFREVALRIYSCIMDANGNEVTGTGIVSDNYVTFSHMAAFNAVKSPAYIYLVGNCTDWTAPNANGAEFYADWRLFEADDAIGSKIFYGTFDMPAGDLQFRFYEALTGWDADSMGPQEEDAGVASVFKDGVFEGSIMYDATKAKFYKGTWLFSGFEGGKVSMTVNLRSKTVKFEVVE